MTANQCYKDNKHSHKGNNLKTFAFKEELSNSLMAEKN